MLWTQYSLEQLQIWFHRCLLFYVQIYFTGVKWTAVSTNKTTLNEAFLQEKALLPTELCDEKFSIEAGEKKKSQRQTWGFLLVCLSHYVLLALMEKELHCKKHGGRSTWNTQIEGDFYISICVFLFPGKVFFILFTKKLKTVTAPKMFQLHSNFKNEITSIKILL